MEKQKILHITFDMEMGGAEQVIRQLIENSNTEVFDSSVLCLDNKVGVIGQELQKQGVNNFAYNRQPGLDLTLVKQLRAYIREQKVSVLHCHQYTPYVYGLLASFGTKAKVLFTEHGRFYPDGYKWKRYILNPFLSFYTDVIVSISKATADALVQYENFPKRKIQVIYNGIKDGNLKLSTNEIANLKKSLGITEQDIVFGTISRLDPIKNQMMMITAFEQVHKMNPLSKLLIIGDGPVRQDLERHVAELKLDDSVIFTGFIVNPQRYFCLMDIFLLPSLSEGTSMTLLEAMAFSIPCIVTDVGGNPEIIIHNESGLVVPNNDSQSLAKAMILLMSDKNLAMSLGQNGKQRYQATFTIEQMVNAYQTIYQELS